MRKVSFLHEAEIEFAQAVAYYEDKARGLGLDFAAEVRRIIAMIAEHPERWPIRVDGTRRCFTRRFPYLIVYTMQDDDLWVIAVAHCKGRPAYWQGRVTPECA